MDPKLTVLFMLIGTIIRGMSHFLLNIAKRSLPRLMLSGVGLANKVAV